MKFGCPFDIFLNSANLICQSTDIWKCFIGSLRLQDNESRLYIVLRQRVCSKSDIIPEARGGYLGLSHFPLSIKFVMVVVILSKSTKTENASICTSRKKN